MGREGTRAPWPPPGSAAAAGAAGAVEEDALSFPGEAVPRSCHSSAPAQLQSQMCPLGMVIAEQGRWEQAGVCPSLPGGAGWGTAACAVPTPPCAAAAQHLKPSAPSTDSDLSALMFGISGLSRHVQIFLASPSHLYLRGNIWNS